VVLIAPSLFAPTTAADMVNVQFLALASVPLLGLVLIAIHQFARMIAQTMVFALVILCVSAMTVGKVTIALRLSARLVVSMENALLLTNANVRRDSLDSLARRPQFALLDATIADTVAKTLEFASVPQDGRNLTA